MKSIIVVFFILFFSEITCFGKQLDSIIINISKRISEEKYDLALQGVESIINSQDYLSCNDSTRNIIHELAYIIYAQNSDFKSSLEYAEKVESFTESKFSKYDRRSARATVDRATINLLLNDEATFKESLRYVIKNFFWDFRFEINLRNFFSINQYLLIDICNGLGLLDNIGRVEEKILYYDITSDLFSEEVGEEDFIYTFLMMSYATFLSEIGMHEEALKLNLDALKIIQKNIASGCKWEFHDQFTSFHNLAANYRNKEMLDSAKYYNYKAIEIGAENTAPIPLAHAYCTRLGLLNVLGEFDAHENIINRIDSIFNFNFKAVETDTIPKINVGYDGFVYAHYNSLKGGYYLQNRDYQKARLFFNKSTNLFFQNGLEYDSFKRIINNNFFLGYLELENGNSESAQKYYDLAIKQYFNILKTMLINLVGAKKEIFIARMKEDFNLYNNFNLINSASNKNSIINILDNRIRTKGLMLYSDIHLNEELKKTDNIDYFNQFKNYNNEISKVFIDYHLKESEKKKKIDSLENIVKKIEVTLKGKLNRNNQDFFSLDVKWEDISKKLSDDEAYIEIIKVNNVGRYPNKYNPEVQKIQKSDTVFKYLIVLIKNNTTFPYFSIIENGKEFEDEIVKNYNYALNPNVNDIRELSSEDLLNKIKNKLKKGYKDCWEKIDKELSKTKKVYISKDGIFYNLNLNLLIDTKGKYLLDKYQIIDISSAKEFIQLNNKNESQRIAAFFGNPDYNYNSENINNITKQSVIDNRKSSILRAALDSIDSYEPLPRTGNEIQISSNILRKSKWETEVFSDKDANEENFKQLSNTSIIHFATHGFFQKDNTNKILENYPLLRNGLLLAGANVTLDNIKKNKTLTSTNDGILSAYEVSKMNFDNTNLVVLSACGTGLGVIQNGEGIYGLQRAFQLAGAKQSIVSLWNVDDEVTQQLMVEFYKIYVKTNDAATSLQEAQKVIRKKYPFPKSWGSFILFGKN